MSSADCSRTSEIARKVNVPQLVAHMGYHMALNAAVHAVVARTLALHSAAIVDRVTCVGAWPVADHKVTGLLATPLADSGTANTASEPASAAATSGRTS